MRQAVVAVKVDNAATTAPCPKCATTMVLAAVTRHPIATHMKDTHSSVLSAIRQRRICCQPVNWSRIWAAPSSADAKTSIDVALDVDVELQQT
jgi:hypothetical protein